MIWFTADTHWGHKNILKYDQRPFATIEEHDRAIIENWNRYVTKNDIVWHLGDFSFRSECGAWPYLCQLNGSVHLISGNHDGKEAHSIRDQFASVRDMAYFPIGDDSLHLCHYKLQVWRKCHYGSFHIFGHSHGTLGEQPGRCLDVGIMTKKWKPDICWLYSFDEIKAYMENREYTQYHDQTEEK